MGKSLPDVSQKVVASAEQYINEFKRAARSQRSSTAEMEREIERFSKSIKRKFSFGDLGKDVLRGFGLGSGFAVASQAAEALVGHYERSAKAAQDIEGSVSRQLDYTRQLIALHQTDQQQLDTMLKDQLRTQRELADLQKPTTVVTPDFIPARGSRERTRPKTDAELLAIQEKATEMQKRAVEIEQLRRKISGADQATHSKATAAASKAAMEAYKDEEAIRLKILDAITRQDEELDRLGERYKELADPTLRFRKQMDEVNLALAAGRLSAEEAARALDVLHRAMADDEAGRVDKALKDFFDPVDERQKEIDAHARDAAKAATDLGWAFSSAFEDAVISGGKLSDVLRGLGQDVLRIALRMAVTKPLGDALGAALGSFSFGKIFGFAGGGDPPVGRASLVGEDGPELIVPRTPSTVIPNHALPGGGSGGVVVNQSFAIAPGVTRSELAAILPQMLEATKQAVADAVQRGGGYRRAFA